MRCGSCGHKGPPRWTVLVAVEIPEAFFGRLTKEAIKRSDVKVEAAHWDRAIPSCSRCGAVTGRPAERARALREEGR